MGKPLDVEAEPSCDFDLHFDIWDLDRERFFKLFEIFPSGKQLAEKAYRLRWGDLGELKTPLINEELLIAEAKKSIDIINKLVPSDELTSAKISVVYGNEKLRLEVLSKADPISVDVDDELSTLIKKANSEQAYNAYFFLSEPMYRLASSYTPRNWVLWTLTNLSDSNPYTPLLKLYYNNSDVALTNDGIVIFKLIEKK
jgi:hypothetical protein